MTETSTLHPIQTNTWVKATWNDFLSTAYSPVYQDGQTYYDHGYMRIEMPPLGSAHGQDNSLISTVVTLYGLAKFLPLKELINTSFRKTNIRECQPDLAYYIGAVIPTLPRDNAPIDVDQVGSPNLVVEIGGTSFSDDLGSKRLLYEQFGVQEYWVVNTKTQAIIAFEISQGRSGRIENSHVLPGLDMTLITTALQRSTTQDTSTLGRWLLQIFRNTDGNTET
jgi:Uma2 family endonuclease